MRRILLAILLTTTCLGFAKGITPDFAYPQTVSNDARVALDKALKTGDMTAVVQNTLALVIAKDNIDTENAAEMVQLLDSVAGVAEMPYRQILYSIEAGLLSDIYQSNKRNVRVQLTTDTLPSNPILWSESQFYDRVSALIGRSLADADVLLNSKCEDYADLLTDNGSVYYPTLYTVLGYRGVDKLYYFTSASAQIPFGELSKASVSQRANEYRKRIIADLIAGYEAKGDTAAVCAVIKDYGVGFVPEDKQVDYLLDRFEAYKDSEYSTLLLTALINRNNLPNNFAELCSQQIARYPNNDRIGLLINYISGLEAPQVEFEYKSLITTDTPLKAKVTMQGVWGDKEVKALLYRLPDDYSGSNYDVVKKVLSRSKLVASIKLPGCQLKNGKSTDTEIDFGPLAVGRYFIAPSGHGTDKLSPLVSNVDIVEVSDLSLYVGEASAVNDKRLNTMHYVWLVNPKDGKPLSDAKVKVTDKKGSYKQTMTSDKNGRIEIPDNLTQPVTITVQANGSKIEKSSYLSNGYRLRNDTTTQVNIYTDLALYHPGDTLQFVAVAYRNDKEMKHIQAGIPLTFTLQDAAYNKVLSLQATTDETGRATGSILLPKAGLAGTYTLGVKARGVYASATTVRVENYAMPTFFVEPDSTMVHSYTIGDNVGIKGRVMTYSGMPIVGAEIDVNINYCPFRPWWRRSYGASDANFSTSAVTDAEGKFNIELPTDRLKGTEYENGYFDVSIKATNPAGESQDSNTFFTIGSNKRLEIDIPSMIEQTGKPAEFKVSVTDTAGEQIKTEATYIIYNTDKQPVLDGVVETGKCSIDLAKLPSAKYNIKFTLVSDSTQTASSDFVLWRRSDKVPPQQSMLWIPRGMIVAQPGQTEVEVIVGSSYPNSYILCVTEGESEVEKYTWLKLNAENKSVKVKVPAGTSPKKMTLITYRDWEVCNRTITISPAPKDDDLKITVTSFRDKIISGTPQRWTFNLSVGGKPVEDAAALVTVSNKALEAITPFAWSPRFSGYQPSYTIFRVSPYAQTFNNSQSYYLSRGESKYIMSLTVPELNMWGQSLYPMYRYYTGGVRYHSLSASHSSAKQSAPMANNDMMLGAAVEESMVADSAEMPSIAEEKSDSLQPEEQTPTLRDAVVPLAYFNPTLVAKGSELEISFDAPDVNTTWQMQLLAYTPNLKSALLTKDLEASKPLMVQGNFPRFVRQGDRVQLRATVYNKSEEVQQADCRFEIFNPATGELLQQTDAPRITLEPMQSDVFTIDYNVPTTAELLGVRVYASNDKFRDGEQMLIGVMSSSSSVIDSQPFYIQPGQKEFSLMITDRSKYEPTVTLLYCDNPVWSCLTALPAVNRLPSNTSLIARLDNLFGTSVSQSIMTRYPQAADSVRSWVETHSPMLVSQLLKNDDLKLTLSTQTPWTEDAQAQTLRMARLYTLLDTDYANSVIAQDIKAILDLQNSDGGFSWCPGMKSSQYMTECFITAMARMKHLDAMPKNKELEKALRSAIRWNDAEILKDYKKDPKHFSYTSMLGYLYAREQAGAPVATGEFKQLCDKTYAEIAANWRKFDIYRAATAAMLLQTEPKYSAKSTEILESLRQRATVKPDRGMYYANLSEGYTGHGQMLTTTRVLQAFEAISPKAESVDLLRQWLLLQRQTTEWGKCTNVSEVLYTLLSTGSNWMSDNTQPTRIYLGDKAIVAEAGLETRVPLFAAGGNKLRIEHGGDSPAWGAVIQQYIAPSTEVQRAAIPDLSIARAMFVVDGDEVTQIPADGSIPQLKVGQTVRIQLTVRNQRDMDYVLVNDPLPACYQPVSQLSGYKYGDGMSGYQEIGKDFVARYIDRLPRGTHIISYDCYVTLEGTFTVPVATVQSQYAPEMTAHTEGTSLKVKNEK